MPLCIELKPQEKLFLGGAVLVNGDSRCQLTLLNDAPLLREKDILTEEGADTPCKRIYLAVQMMYMDQANLPKYHQLYWGLVRDVVAAAPSATGLVDEISGEILQGNYYQGLKSVRKLIQYEKELIEHVQQSA